MKAELFSPNKLSSVIIQGNKEVIRINLILPILSIELIL